MKRMPSKFYKELRDLRAKYGHVEYDREDALVPAVMALMDGHGTSGADLQRDAARAMLDSVERADEDAAQGLFPLEAHVALGEGRRIKRGFMNQGQMYRRKRVIDRNKAAQDLAWREETEWLNSGIDALQGRSPETKYCDVLTKAAE